MLDKSSYLAESYTLKMKGLVKANTVDKYLRPIRLQMAELIDPNSTVIDFGCGNGDLLFTLSDKIQHGIGLDKSESLVSYASKRTASENVSNLEFKVLDLTHEPIAESTADYAVASLLLHVLEPAKAIELLDKIIESANSIIICGFIRPENLWQRLLLWLDQRFSSHYRNFKQFKQKGYTEGLLRSIDNLAFTRIDTFDPVIKIYKVVKQKST